MQIRPPTEILKDWEPIMIHIEKEPFTGLTRDVPGWKCRKCGAQYGCVEPPVNCWKCKEEKTQ